MGQCQAELENMRELLNTYESNLNKKDAIINNVTAALAKEVIPEHINT
jgi:hypothetical protein